MDGISGSLVSSAVTAVALAVCATSAVAAPAPSPPPAAVAAPAGATLDQIELAVASMFGPTGDLLGELRPWVPVPEDVPTPEGAELIDFSFSIDADADADEASYYGSIDFVSTAAPAELVTFFETSLVAAGYTKTADGTQTQQGSTQRDLTFESPDPALGYGGLTVQVLDSDVDYGRLSWSYDTTPVSLAPFSAWYADFPVPPGGELYGASLSSFTGFGERSVSVASSLQYTGVPAETQRATLLDALPFADFTLAPDDDPGDEFVDVLSPRFPAGISVYLYDWDFPEGSSRLKLDTSLDLPTP